MVKVREHETNLPLKKQILKAFLPGMMEKNHGHIVSIASIAGMIGAYQLADYSASKFAAIGLEEALSLELNCDGYDGIHSTVVCPYYIATGMFSGIGRSLIPILTPDYVASETVKAVLVNQEVLCLPMIVYWLLLLKPMLPSKSFLWAHRAIGAASTMKTFTGRTGPASPQNLMSLLNNKEGSKLDHVTIKMAPAPAQPASIGIIIPEKGQQLNQ